jgi:hypothetical protein
VLIYLALWVPTNHTHTVLTIYLDCCPREITNVVQLPCRLVLYQCVSWAGTNSRECRIWWLQVIEYVDLGFCQINWKKRKRCRLGQSIQYRADESKFYLQLFPFDFFMVIPPPISTFRTYCAFSSPGLLLMSNRYLLFFKKPRWHLNQLVAVSVYANSF